MLRKIVSAMARGRNGMALLPVVIGVAAVGLLISPVLRWYFSMIQGTANLEDRLEMQMITQEYLGRINAATYDELVQTAAARGGSWTEDVRDGKYEARIEIGEDGKFADAKCDTEAAIGDGDKRCRTATITLTSKSDPAQVMNLSTISVSVPSRIPEIQRRLSVQDDRFGEYYTKGEGDSHYACPWDYHLVGNKCVPCDAPTWKQYRNGNCSLYTCPTGQKANAAGNGCEQITCPAGKVLDGDDCVDPIKKVSDSCIYVPKGTYIGNCRYSPNNPNPSSGNCGAWYSTSTAPVSLNLCCSSWIAAPTNGKTRPVCSSGSYLRMQGVANNVSVRCSIGSAVYSDQYRSFLGFSVLCRCHSYYDNARCGSGYSDD